MKLYQMQVTKTAIYRTAPARIPRGITGAALELRFSEEWEGLKKTAVFRAGDVTRDVLDVGSTVVIPWECTQEAGAVLEVGIYGTGEDRAIPTLWAVIGTVCEATDPSGDTGTDPALPVWAQLQNRTNDLQDQLDQLEEQGVRDKSIDEAVAGYIADNPIVPEDLGIAPAEVGVFAAEGTVVTASGTGALPPHSLKLFGRTVQNGTPSPDSPVPLESMGDSGGIGVTVAGKNLHDLSKVYEYNKLFPLILPAGTPITFSTYPSAGTSQLNAEVLYSDGTKDAFNIVGSNGANGVWHTKKFTATKNTKSYMLYDVTGSAKRTIDKLMLRIGNFDATTDADYEPYKETQTLTAATPNGLPGVPAASGGNYTDENGQAWVCDEIDFARGKYLQRIKKFIFDGSLDEAWTANTLNRFSIALPDVEYPANNDIKGTGLSNALTMATANKLYENPSEVAMALNAVSKMFFIRVRTTFTTVDELRAWLSANPLTVLLIAANTIETALSEEELAAFAAMRTNDPNTVVYNDAMAPMRLEYYTPISALPVAGGSMGGNLRMAGNRVTDLGTPSANGDAVNKAYSDSKLVEDIGYPGCYYRMVDGVEEWLNPPMVTGVEYRTTERFENMVVFAKLIDYGALPTGGSYKRYNISGGTAVRPISAIAVLSSGEVIGNGQGFAVSNSRSYSINVTTTTTQVEIYSPTADYSALTATVLVKYTKDI